MLPRASIGHKICRITAEFFNEIDPELSLVTDCLRAAQSGLLLDYCLARFLGLLPVRRVLEWLAVFDDRLLCVMLLRQHIAPHLGRIGPVRR
jgi:hypothetical protein